MMNNDFDNSLGDIDYVPDGEDNASSSGDDGSTGTVDSEAKEDIKLMNVIRAIVILIILTIAFISAETIFIVTTIAEENDFSDAYDEAAGQLIEGFHKNLDDKLWVARTLSTDISNAASDSSWPNVTIKNFEDRCEGPLHLSGASVISLSPLVSKEQLDSWEQYVASVPQEEEEASFSDSEADSVLRFDSKRTLGEGVYRFEDGTALSLDSDPSLPEGYFPMRQVSPSLGNDTTGIVGTLFDESTNSVRFKTLQAVFSRSGSSLSNFLFGDTNDTDYSDYGTPRSSLYYPVVVKKKIKPVAVLGLELKWEKFFENTVDDMFEGLLHVVVDSSCGGQFTFNITGPQAVYGGEGDLHDKTLEKEVDVLKSTYQEFATVFDDHGVFPMDTEEEESSCFFKVTVYASPSFKGNYLSTRPDKFRGFALLGFFAIVLIFLGYDAMVERRQNKVVQAAVRSDAIVRSLFPQNVRNQLYENAKKKEEEQRLNKARDAKKGMFLDTQKHRLKRFMSDGATSEEDTSNAGALRSSFSSYGGSSAEFGGYRTPPIADLFPAATVLFADIAGFTAWSSEREPAQVFTLLETIYGAMDKVAKKHGVFKVETIGDCYVAATGIPDQVENHAEVMVKFAKTCCYRINSLTSQLEANLGPGTAELSMRFGIHSGPVTAGVLRGQKARFQLFGDTMNTAARIESSGAPNRIHLSSETANRLIARGHGHWVTPRQDRIQAKGKGFLTTYWLSMGAASSSKGSSDASSESSADSIFEEERVDKSCYRGNTELESVFGHTEIDGNLDRLVKWNANVLLSLLESVVASRTASATPQAQASDSSAFEKKVTGPLARDEIKMAIPLPEFDPEVAVKAASETVILSHAVKREMRDYVAAIASGYRKNAFHSFEHASHVILSATKLLKRIMSLDEVQQEEGVLTSHDLHEHTYGIGTDALTQFAVVFSALIHDVGHVGVSNAQLSVEQPEVAERYGNKSVAEQRSIDTAWQLLMLPRFKNLRECIYQNEAEHDRFRMLVVNSIMATDIFDGELKAIRNSRWDLAFHGSSSAEQARTPHKAIDSKATVVIEHIIQASDVSHTMQHWVIYTKWNERLFQEMYDAYRKGRMEKDPSEGWYGGELWFFDNYVIPLAYKLKECGVFGASGDELLNYAEQNRDEWEKKGHDVVAAMKQRFLESEGIEPAMDTVDEALNESSSGIEVEIDLPSSTPSHSSLGLGECKVVAPPGKLDIVIEPSEEEDGLPLIHEVSSGSPLEGKLFVGDRIAAIDGVGLKGFSIEAVFALIQVRVDQNREFIVFRSC